MKPSLTSSGFLTIRPEQANAFFKLMEDRYTRHPTIITTNLDYEEWYALLGNKGMVDALLSRLRHRCHTVKIDGPSLPRPARVGGQATAPGRSLPGGEEAATACGLEPAGSPVNSLRQ